LPLVMPAQAQKHVTVNEAFVRLDAAVQMRFERSTLRTPPSGAAEGHRFIVPAGATGEWADASGKIASRSNGGWVYLTPSAGWTGWDQETATRLFFDGLDWLSEPQAISKSGAATLSKIVEFDHEVYAGANNVTSVAIPSHSQVLAVTGRVRTSIEGSGTTGWQLGVDGSDDRYGSSIGLSLNSSVVGMSGQPVTYYADTPLKITSQGGDLLSGAIRFCVHITAVLAPRPFE